MVVLVAAQLGPTTVVIPLGKQFAVEPKEIIAVLDMPVDSMVVVVVEAVLAQWAEQPMVAPQDRVVMVQLHLHCWVVEPTLVAEQAAPMIVVVQM
jgi:hypothetical protein